MKKWLVLTSVAFASFCFGQKASSLNQEVLLIEKRYKSLIDSSNGEGCNFIGYNYKTIDWEDEITETDVRIYSAQGKSYTRTNDVNLFFDKDGTVLEMPQQKLIVINGPSKAVKNEKLDYYEKLKQEFFDSCEVVKHTVDENGAAYLHLRNNVDFGDVDIYITEIKYNYNIKDSTIQKVEASFGKRYKLKSTITTYTEIEVNKKYQIADFRKEYFTKEGNLRERFKDYEIMDNRENSVTQVKKKNR